MSLPIINGRKKKAVELAINDSTHDPKIRFLVGIDEAGRGPLAGPVSVGVVVVPVHSGLRDIDSEIKNRNQAGRQIILQTNHQKIHPLFLVAKDSKMLTPVEREKIFGKIQTAQKEGTLGYSVSCVSSKIIDSRGIVFAIRLAISRSLRKIGVPPHQTLVLLDGSLSAPDHFLFQKTIIRGDQSEPVISLASIAAKVVRDKKMIQLAKKYPEFGFEIHKGYGTLFHRQKIKKHGPSEIHRRSFMKTISFLKPGSGQI